PGYLWHGLTDTERSNKEVLSALFNRDDLCHFDVFVSHDKLEAYGLSLKHPAYDMDFTGFTCGAEDLNDLMRVCVAFFGESESNKDRTLVDLVESGKKFQPLEDEGEFGRKYPAGTECDSFFPHGYDTYLVKLTRSPFDQKGKKENLPTSFRAPRIQLAKSARQALLLYEAHASNFKTIHSQGAELEEVKRATIDKLTKERDEVTSELHHDRHSLNSVKKNNKDLLAEVKLWKDALKTTKKAGVREYLIGLRNKDRAEFLEVPYFFLGA
ncbi:hypothetical protein V2J09_006073, partial [Rumex salicifolius]